MRTPKVALLVLVALGVTGVATIRAAGGHAGYRPCGHPGHYACGAGYIVVEETRYRQVVGKVCRVVPDVKKETKVVYHCQEEWDCVLGCHQGSSCAHAHHGQPNCGRPDCRPPRSRKVLLKKLVTEEVPTSKCVVEDVVKTVPYRVHRKVWVGAAPSH